MQADFVGLIAYNSVRVELENGSLVKVDLDESPQSASPSLFDFDMVSLVYRKDTVLSTTSKALVREIRAECNRKRSLRVQTYLDLPSKQTFNSLCMTDKTP